MIIAVFPFKSNLLRDKVIANLVVDVGLVRLAELVTTGDAVEAAVLDEKGAGLVETEGDVAGYALLAEGKNPVVVARACIDAGLAAG